MKIEKISYRRLFPTGAYENQSIELTASLSDNEDILNAYSELHKMAQELHYSKNAEIYEQMGTKVEEIEPVDSRPLLEIINTCTDIEVLGSYKLLVRNDEELNNAFRKKLIELSNP